MDRTLVLTETRPFRPVGKNSPDRRDGFLFETERCHREASFLDRKAEAGLHDNVPADLLPRWQKVRQSSATQPRGTDVLDWVTTSAVQLAFWKSDIVNSSAIVASWHPTGAPWQRVGLGRCSATQPWILLEQNSPRQRSFLIWDRTSLRERERGFFI